MKLNTQKFSLAAALTMGAIYVVCLVLVLLWPDFTLQLLGWLVHIVNVDKFAGDVQITFVGFVFGLLQVLVYTYLVALLGAWLHNKFLRE